MLHLYMEIRVFRKLILSILVLECMMPLLPCFFVEQSSMVFYENSGLQNLYDIVRYCLVSFVLVFCFLNSFFYQLTYFNNGVKSMCVIRYSL